MALAHVACRVMIAQVLEALARARSRRPECGWSDASIRRSGCRWSISAHLLATRHHQRSGGASQVVVARMRACRLRVRGRVLNGDGGSCCLVRLLTVLGASGLISSGRVAITIPRFSDAHSLVRSMIADEPRAGIADPPRFVSKSRRVTGGYWEPRSKDDGRRQACSPSTPQMACKASLWISGLVNEFRHPARAHPTQTAGCASDDT